VPATESPLFRAVSELRQAGRPIVDLTVTNPTAVGFAGEVSDVVGGLSDARALCYEPEALGLLEARAAVAREWGRRGVVVGPEAVALTASTSEAYAHCFRLFCDPGDEVLVPRPSYPLIDEIARYEGIGLSPYRIDYDGAWHVDVDSARLAVGSRTRAILAVSPNNPTGCRLTEGDVCALGSLGLPLVVDEVFATYPVDAAGVTSALGVDDVPLVVLDGLSKVAALPQMKVGWMTLGGPHAFVADARRRLEVMLDAFLSVGTPAQWALAGWLDGAAARRAPIRARIRDNVARLRAACAGTAVTAAPVEAGWFAMLRLPAVLSDDAWVHRLLSEAGVLLHPGWLYDVPGGPWVVASLIVPPEDLARGAERLVALVADVAR
jgi:aspartate/methionine/tyrosine aminotransferase